jgi:esterase
VTLHTRRYGEKHAKQVVIIHGLFGSGDNWHGVAQELSSEYSVLLPDLPNHGQSPHTDDMLYPAIVEDLAETLEEHGVEHAVLMGHSMGGKVAMKFALDHPDRVAGLVVVDIAPRSYPGYHRDIIQTMRSVPVATLTARNEADRYLAKGIADRGVRAFLMKNLVRSEDGQGYAWRLNLPVIEAQYAELSSWPGGAGAYHGPVLFVAGGKSPYMADFTLGEVAPLFPEAEIETIADAGHWVHAEARDRFVPLVTRFLHRAIEPGAAS